MQRPSAKRAGDRPLVSVVVVCYNHERYVVECLESVRRQSMSDYELIVLDDASQDCSPTLIGDWWTSVGQRGAVVLHERNRGLTATLNEAKPLVRGKYVCLLAADDRLKPDKLERHSVELEHDESLSFVYSDAELIDAEGRTLPGTWQDLHGVTGHRHSGDIYGALLRFGSFVPSMSLLARTTAFLERVEFDEASFHEDWSMQLDLAAWGPVAFSDYIGTEYRVLEQSLARTMPTWQSQLTNVRLLIRQLDNRPECRALIRRRLLASVYALWETGHPSRSAAMREVLATVRSPSAIGVALLAKSGVPLRHLVWARRILLKFPARHVTSA